MNTWEKLLELLGRTPDDPLFSEFISHLGESPHIVQAGRHAQEFEFPNSGIYMMFKSVEMDSDPSLKFEFAFLHPRRGYTGTLPGGVTLGDRREDIERKFGHGEIRQAGEDAWMPSVTYDLDAVQVRFGLSQKDQQLLSVRISIHHRIPHNAQEP